MRKRQAELKFPTSTSKGFDMKGPISGAQIGRIGLPRVPKFFGGLGELRVDIG
jgi:hypothetical protein